MLALRHRDRTGKVAGEVQVLRERLDTTERLARRKGLYTAEHIEAHELTEADELERERWRDEYMAGILGIVDQETEGLRQKESRARTRAEVESVAAP